MSSLSSGAGTTASSAFPDSGGARGDSGEAGCSRLPDSSAITRASSSIVGRIDSDDWHDGGELTLYSDGSIESEYPECEREDETRNPTAREAFLALVEENQVEGESRVAIAKALLIKNTGPFRWDAETRAFLNSIVHGRVVYVAEARWRIAEGPGEFEANRFDIHEDGTVVNQDGGRAVTHGDCGRSWCDLCATDTESLEKIGDIAEAVKAGTWDQAVQS